MDPYQIIKRPLVTEKANWLKESGGKEVYTPEEVQPKVLFEVNRRATKIQIRQAVEKIFNVKVVGVSTQIVRGKKKRVGQFMGRRPNWKRAIVTLVTGSKVEFFEGT